VSVAIAFSMFLYSRVSQPATKAFGPFLSISDI
jgi:hypothetical protein